MAARLAVVIPLYNHERFIADALQSVFAQTIPVQRIVVVDDGSTDGSREVVGEFKDARIVLIAQANAGAHVALNRAIAEAGEVEYIAVLNSDDRYHPERLAKCVEFLEANPHSEVVCTTLKLISDDGLEVPATNPRNRWLRTVWSSRSDSLPEWLGVANFAKTSSNFVGRQAWFSAHPFRAYRFVHDYFFALICALEGKLAVLDEALLFYRVHTSNTIKAGSADLVKRETLRMNLDVLAEIAPRLASSASFRQEYTSYFRQLAGNHADFRLEVFLSLIAGIVARESKESLASVIAGLATPEYPELTARPSALLKEKLKQKHKVDAIEASKWWRLGRKLGFSGKK